MAILFWLILLLAIYPHIIYPSVLYMLSWMRKNPRNGSRAQGRVAIICSVYNEEKVIAQKIKNFYRLEYPDIQLYLGLDGCTDTTLNEIRRTSLDDRVKVIVYPRGGKVNVINRIMKDVNQPFIVMTDANSMFRPDAVTKLMEQMQNNVGVVCGRLILIDEGGYFGEGIYWRIETFIKKVESRFGSVIGANGAIYLFRRSLFEPLPPNTINDDFSVSMRIYERGYDIVYADEAIAEERLIASHAEEYRRHVRDSAGHFRALRYHWRLLSPFRGKRFFFYVSHRVLRWMVPFLLIFAMVANILLSLQNQMYLILLLIHCVGYGLILVTHFLRLRWKPLYVPYYFMLINSAIFVGFIKNLFGLQKTSWESTRR